MKPWTRRKTAALLFTAVAATGFAVAISKSDTCSAFGWWYNDAEEDIRIPWIVHQRFENCRRWSRYRIFDGYWTTREGPDDFRPTDAGHAHGSLLIDEAALNLVFDRILNKPYGWGKVVRIRFWGNELTSPRSESDKPRYLVRRIVSAQLVSEPGYARPTD